MPFIGAIFRNHADAHVLDTLAVRDGLLQHHDVETPRFRQAQLQRRGLLARRRHPERIVLTIQDASCRIARRRLPGSVGGGHCPLSQVPVEGGAERLAQLAQPSDVRLVDATAAIRRHIEQ